MPPVKPPLRGRMLAHTTVPHAAPALMDVIKVASWVSAVLADVPAASEFVPIQRLTDTKCDSVLVLDPQHERPGQRKGGVVLNAGAGVRRKIEAVASVVEHACVRHTARGIHLQ